MKIESVLFALHDVGSSSKCIVREGESVCWKGVILQLFSPTLCVRFGKGEFCVPR